MREGITVEVSAADRARLRAVVADRNSPQKHVWRAEIILATADGLGTSEIMRRAGVSKPCVWRWQERFMREGVAGLLRDKARPSRIPPLPQAVIDRVVGLTTSDPPHEATHWTAAAMAAAVGVSLSSVQRIWRAHRLRPHQVRTFKLSKDPRFAAKLRDIVGLYVDPPKHAVVLCVDEKSQIQALDRTAPMLPMQPGLPERRTHDYVRHGTTTLFAALNIATGTVTARCQPRHRHQEFLRFLRQVARAYPDRELHLVMDNYAAHKRVEIRDWLTANPRVHVHFTPTSASWMNLVEVWFGIIERQAIHRGSFASVTDLTRRIRTFIDGWNDRCHPFVWTKTAEQILAKADRKKTSDAPH
ncbi:MAG: IS630 family transposase [Thermoleophilia bacterium]